MGTVDLTNIEDVAIETELRELAARVFASLPRSDQRRWAQHYLLELLRQGPRSISRTAQTLPGRSAVQSLQQFINQSPWDWTPVRAQVALEVDKRLRTRAWTAVNLVVPKRGDKAAGVDRRFVPALDRTVNCQAAVGLLLTGGTTGIPVNWRLLLSPRWAEDPQRRREARIPPSACARAEHEELFEMLGELREWGLPQQPVIAQWRGLPAAADLIGRMAGQGYSFLVNVDPSTGVVRQRGPRSVVGHATLAQTPIPVSRHAALSARIHHRVAATDAATGREEIVRLVQLSVALPAYADPPGRVVPLRLLVIHRPGYDGPPEYWITNMRDATPSELVGLWQLPRVDRPVGGTLHEKLGMHVFTGRSFIGWHHHVTLASTAIAVQELLSAP